MRLKELLQYQNITIQCHDNPDADAIASGYALYEYFKSQGKEVRLIYGGRNVIRKSNLVMMVKELEIPIEHIHHMAGERKKGPACGKASAKARDRRALDGVFLRLWLVR